MSIYIFLAPKMYSFKQFYYYFVDIISIFVKEFPLCTIFLRFPKL